MAGSAVADELSGSHPPKRAVVVGVTGPDPVRMLIERLSIALYERGESRMTSRVVMALLCAQGDRLTAKELMDRLEVSPAAVSTAVNHLAQVGLITRDRVPGSRQEQYGLPPGGILAAVMRQTTARPDIAALAEEGVSVVGGPSTPGGARLGEIAEFFEFLDAEMRGIWERWHARPAARRGEDSCPD